MKTYIICNLIFNIIFVMGTIFLTVYFNNLKFLWLLIIPLLNQVSYSVTEKFNEEKK